MDSLPTLRSSDAAVVARYLQLRGHLHDRLLARVETLLQTRYYVHPTRHHAGSLVALVRGVFGRPGEAQGHDLICPVVFLTTVDVTLALCLQITAERLANLGTVINGPQRSKHRHWEDWWGWEAPLTAVHGRFFELAAVEQEDAMTAWFGDRLEWLAANGLLRRKTHVVQGGSE